VNKYKSWSRASKIKTRSHY